MLKLVFVCDKCGKEVEQQLVSPLELDRANWRNIPEGWESVGIGEKVIFLCDHCNIDVLAQKQQIKNIEAQVVTDVTAAVSAIIVEK